MERKIGLIGIGLVGTALAGNLLARGWGVLGYDVDEARRRDLERIGGEAASGPRDVASHASFLLLSLPNAGSVRAVLAGDEGVLRAEPLPAYVIDTTTGDPGATDELARHLAGRGVRFLDATIAGSSEEVRARQAAFLVGAEDADFAACQDLFAAITERAFHVGPPGAGARAKLVTNLVLGLNRVALAEGLVLAEKLGLEPERALSLLAATSSYSRVMDVKGKKMVRGDFTPQARLAQHRKDVGLILDAAAKAGQSLPLSEAHRAILDAAVAAGDGDLDNCAVINELRRHG